MKIISFTGPKGSGKDTAAAILKDCGISKGKISFAGPMKQILSDLLGLELASFEDPELKERPFDFPVILTRDLIFEIYSEMKTLLPESKFLFYPLTPFPVDDLQNTPLLTRRHALQFIGTEFIRNRIHPDWHVAAAFRKQVLNNLDPDGVYCVTDARFVNEYIWLKMNIGLDFTGFYVARPSAEILLAAATHPSETEVRDVRKLIEVNPRFILKNDGTVDELKAQILIKLGVNTNGQK